MNVSRLVLVRHGMPDIVEGVPSVDWHLSAAGHEAALRLAGKLGEFRFDGIVTSPEPKAIGTAEAIASRHNLPVSIDPDLAEHHRRSVGYLPRIEIEEGIAYLFARPDERVFGDETAFQALARFSTAIDWLSGNDAVAVTHGTSLTLYVSRRTGIEPRPFWRNLGLATAVVPAGDDVRVISPD